jgi:hypothetical protein
MVAGRVRQPVGERRAEQRRFQEMILQCLFLERRFWIMQIFVG